MAKADLRLQKRLAAEVAGVGLDRISFDPTQAKDIEEAITKADIRALISQDIIKVLPIKRPSRHRARLRHLQRKKGRRRGAGKRKGTAKARLPKKTLWMNTIRSQRKLLKYLRKKKKITPQNFRKVYAKANGGEFRSKAHMTLYLQRNNLLKAQSETRISSAPRRQKSAPETKK